MARGHVLGVRRGLVRLHRPGLPHAAPLGDKPDVGLKNSDAEHMKMWWEVNLNSCMKLF